MPNRKKLLQIAIVVVVAGFYAITERFGNEQTGSAPEIKWNQQQSDNSTLLRAISNRQSDVQVIGSGTVVKLLRDDTRGSQHQRFLVEVDRNKTILIAHNIDLAPRVNELREGDTIRFNGEFEWNDKGGVVHWTHKDPRGKHVHGWLQHQGKKYW